MDPDDPAYFQQLRWLGFIATELHKQLLRVVFYAEATPSVKQKFRALIPDRFALLETELSRNEYLLGDGFTSADAYLTWFCALAGPAGVSLESYPNFSAYAARMLSRNSIVRLIAEDEARKQAQKG